MPRLRRLMIGVICTFLAGQHLSIAAGATAPESSATAALIVATDRGDAQAVESSLNDGADANTLLRGGETVLMWAALRRDLRLIRLLLDRGANVNARGNACLEVAVCPIGRMDRGGRTALMVAASLGDLAAVRLLLERGAAVQLKDNGGTTAFFHAAWSGNAAVLPALLRHGEDIDARDGFRRTALHVAVFKSRALVKALVAMGCDVDAQDMNGDSALMWTGNDATIDVLLRAGADRSLKNKWGKTAWHVATELGAGSAAKRVRPDRLDPQSARDSRLMGAIRKKDVAGVRKLLAAGANANMTANGGTTPLIFAAGEGQIEIVRELLQHKADANTRGIGGKTALMAACERDQGNLQVVQLLLASGADVQAVDRLGRTAFNEAAQGGYAAILEALMASGVNVNSRDHYCTALYAAVCSGNAEAVRVLIAHGADVNAPRWDGETPLQRARSQANGLAAMLEQAGAKR
jgi:ankyrin repeat protein